MGVSYVMRFKILAFFVVCFILWEALRHFPFQDIPEQESSYRWETVMPSVNSAISPIILSVFYEALCPDSRSFFTKQLLPTFEKIPQLLQVNLVPYGKAKTESIGGSYSFTCQHGPIECQANKVHACAIAKIDQRDLQLKYTTCMISDNMNPVEIGEQCAQELGITWKVISDCVKSNEGDELLKHHGDKTNELHPRISFVPTIVLDQSQDNQPALLKNLFKEVCIHLHQQKSQPIPECD